MLCRLVCVVEKKMLRFGTAIATDVTLKRRSRSMLDSVNPVLQAMMRMRTQYNAPFTV